MIKSFDELLKEVKRRPPKPCMVAVAHDRASLEGLNGVVEEGIAKGVLFGDEVEIRREAEELGISLDGYEIYDLPDPSQAVAAAVRQVKERGGVLMKGKVSTSAFLKGVLDKEYGLRTGRLLSHVAVLELPTYHKLLLVTDGGVNIRPDLTQKAAILCNAVELANSLGIERPKVALLAAVETVSFDMPETMEWAELAKMAERGQLGDVIVDGPLALDLAVSREAAEIKGVRSPVAGDADILVMPEIAAGNIFAKGLLYLARAEMGGVIMGAQAPVVMLSRADSPKNKLHSIALGGLLA